MKKKLLSVLLASCMVLSLAACGASSETPASNSTDNAQQATDSTGSDATATDSAAAGTNTGVINVCLASEPATLDPALNSAVDGATMINHLFSGLAKWGLDASGNLELQPDCAEELVEGVENEDGTVTYTYTLKDGLTWSDGQPVTAGDFVFAWNRAIAPETAADYGYMFEVVDGYADGKLNVNAVDDKTLEVTLANTVAYWNELLAFPTYMPVREDVVANESWATDPSTYVGNGAYVMSSWAALM